MLIKNPPVALADNLWMLGTSAYPLYLVRGEREAALFEGGIGAMGKMLGEQLQQLGIPGESIKQVVVTHAHPDHVMAVPIFRSMFPGVAVLASAAAAKTLGIEKAIAAFCDVDRALSGALVKMGSIGDRHRPEPLAERQIAIDRLLKEGDAVAVDGHSFTVLETPGHSDCSLSFHEPRAGILIVSDATGYYMPDDNTWWPNYFTDYGKYVASMRRLAGLGAEVLCLSHNAAIRGGADVAAYFRDCIATTEAYHRRICEAIKSGTPVRQLAEELGGEIHAKTPVLPVEFFQKNCGILIKQSLRYENMAAEKQ
jgi:glyoxylase-like metal-dependent hydrolase (beta-lactamase superfamily II)